MFPTKSMLDYMMEINRLFPRENDFVLSPTPMNHIYNQSMARSSSSTDTSPDSFPDMIGYRFAENPQTIRLDHRSSEMTHNQGLDFANNHFEPFSPPQIYETPLVTRRQRPIVSRKVITELYEHDEVPNTWNNRNRHNSWTEESITSPNAHVNQIVYYELFPSVGKEKQSESIKNSSHTLSQMSNVSLRSTTTDRSMYESGISQWTETTSSEVSDFSTSPSSTVFGMSPGSSKSPRALLPSRLSYQEPIYGPSTSFNSSGCRRKICSFCRRNGETPLVYTTHKVKEKIEGKYIVTCPILRSHICATCGASGDDAHTKSYCPVICQNNNGKPIQSTTVRLKNTRLKSNGYLRRRETENIFILRIHCDVTDRIVRLFINTTTPVLVLAFMYFIFNRIQNISQ